jgi:hypothetical protein
MEQAIFRGEVKEPGRFVAFDPVRFQAWLRMHVGQPVEVVLRDPQSQRTLDQNAYLHHAFRIIADYTGDDIKDIKWSLMGHRFGWHYSKLAGREIPIKAHTSDMTRAEADEFIDWLPAWAMEHLGVVVPLPNEVPAERG